MEVWRMENNVMASSQTKSKKPLSRGGSHLSLISLRRYSEIQITWVWLLLLPWLAVVPFPRRSVRTTN